MFRGPVKPRGQVHFKLTDARRMFQAGADKVVYCRATDQLIGYKTGQGETPPTEPANSWDAVLPDAPK